MTNLDSILKSRDITLPAKVHLVKAMVFPAVMYGCESWTIKKVEHQRIDAFELWCWRRLLRVPWTARRPNQSVLKEISPGCSLEVPGWSWNSNSLATWCKERWHHRLNRHEFGWAPGVGVGQGGLACCDSWGRKELDMTERLNCIELNWSTVLYYLP